jgi:TPR repeat protein/tRNA A-37 threonylcarbamoyl transferase component Bud32
MLGQVVGNYHILGVLGEGGMGVVYLGQHTLIDRRAAIKVLLPEYSRDQEIVRRFFTEARAANAIQHPGIVEIYDFGHHQADGRAFIVMELLQGESLQQRLERLRGLAPADAVLLTRQIAGALGAAHRASIVHRDLKPDNIFIVRDPEVPGGERIKLLDFGIAKLADPSVVPAHERTRAGVIMGTPTYMAPEQCRGSVDIDHRADLYALGCILYRMVCGRTPFAGMGQGETLAAHIHVPVPPPRALVPGLPPALEALILRLLEKDPAARYPSADALIADLDRLSMTGVISQSPRQPPRGASESGHAVSTLGYAAGAQPVSAAGTAPPRRRSLVLGGTLAAFAVVGAVAAAFAMWGRDPGVVVADAGVAILASDAAVVAARGADAGAGEGSAATARVPVTADACEPALAQAARIMAAGVDSESASYRYYARYLDTPDEARRMLDDCVSSYDGEALACLGRAATPADVARCGNALSERQCQYGDQVGCVSLGWRLYAGGEYEQAAKHARSACESGVSSGCMLLATQHFYGRGAALDRAAARRLYERSHALGDPDGGSALADMLYRGIGGRPEPARAREIFEQVCEELPVHSACAGLGELEDRGVGGREARRRARERFEATCSIDLARGCDLLAGQSSGAEAEALYAKARELYELTASQAPRSAFHLAVLVRDGKGGPPDPARAAEMLVRACEDNEPLACEAAGDGFVSGRIPVDLRRSSAAYQGACTAGIERGCLGVECQRLLAGDDQAEHWGEQVRICRESGLLPKTRRPVSRPRAAPSPAAGAARPPSDL